MLSPIMLTLGLAPMGVVRMKESGAVAAILSGVVFGLGGLFTKAMTDKFLGDDAGSIALRIVANPYAYAVVAANIVRDNLLCRTRFTLHADNRDAAFWRALEHGPDCWRDARVRRATAPTIPRPLRCESAHSF